MIPRPLQLVFLLAVSATAQEIPRAIQIAEPPPSMVVGDPNRIVSSSHQFRIAGGESGDRAALALLAEEAKSELLQLTGEKDGFLKSEQPIDIVLHGKPGDPLPSRTEAVRITYNELGYKVILDIHLSRGIDPERVRFAATSALLYFRTLKDFPKGSETPLQVPPWLADGLREAAAWQHERTDRKLYEALFKTGGLFKLDELFSLSPAGFDEMDAAMRAAFRVSSGSLVMALLQQPQGKEGFRSFLTEVAGYQGEMPSLLRKHFPELNLSETSLAKWWALQLANIGGRNLTTDIMTVAATETALAEALRLDFRGEAGAIERKDLSAWPEVAALPQADRAKTVRLAEDALVRLSYRCFPSYRPMLEEYRNILGGIAKNETADVAKRIDELATRRQVMVAKALRARDYLDWFEITTARETSGAFDDYLRLKQQLKENPRHRGDHLSKYLDRLEAVFSRGPTGPKPLAPAAPAIYEDPYMDLELGDLPPLPPLPQ